MPARRTASSISRAVARAASSGRSSPSAMTWAGTTIPPSRCAIRARTGASRRAVPPSSIAATIAAPSGRPSRAGGAIRAAARVASTDEVNRLNTMTTTTAFTTSSPNSPTEAPTVVAARVAAACDSDREKVTSTCGPAEPADPPDRQRRAALAEHERDREHDRQLPRPRVREHRRVDQQADRHEERRDEQRPAEELHAVHQRAAVGHEAVEREPGEERPDDALDAAQLRDERRGQERGEDEDEPQRRGPAQPREEPAGEERQRRTRSTRRARPARRAARGSSRGRPRPSRRWPPPRGRAARACR